MAQRFDGKLYDFSELAIVYSVVRSVTQSSALLALIPEPVWFCLKTQPKREHLAATALRRQFGVECFSPRLRFRRMTQRGPVWFVEAMFPGYLFAKFIYSTQHRAVESGSVSFSSFLGGPWKSKFRQQKCSLLKVTLGHSGARSSGHCFSSFDASDARAPDDIAG